jgi:hypothetical protein
MSGVEKWNEYSELPQDPGEQKQEKAGHRGKRRFALIALRTSCFDCALHHRTRDLSARKMRAVAVAAADLQTSA